MLTTDILIRPVVTEKTNAQTRQYTFVVHPQATKPAVARAVKDFYGVEVDRISVSHLPAKTRLVGRGRTTQKRKKLKKATFSLKDGKTLDFNAFK